MLQGLALKAAIAAGLVLTIVGLGWFILHQREQLGHARAALSTAVAASEANAELAKWERADREFAQAIAARYRSADLARQKQADAEKEATYVPDAENGPVAPVLRRQLDRLPDAGPGALGAAAAAGDRSRVPAADTGPDAAPP